MLKGGEHLLAEICREIRREVRGSGQRTWHLRSSTPTTMFSLRTDVVEDWLKLIGYESEKVARVLPVRAGAKASSPSDVILDRVQSPIQPRTLA